jgi:uncharacterized protein YjbI with pentapeptide repeats/beta-lactamase regulating signal transducer with metallopeptidase domain
MISWPQEFVTASSALAATALNALWQDALLVLGVWLVLRAWPGINAATRYTVWSATLLAAFVVPVATTLPFFAAPHQVAIAPTRLSRDRAPVTLHPGGSAKYSRETPPSASSPPPARLPERLRVTLPAQVAVAVFIAWLLLAAYALVRLAAGLLRLEQLKRDALPLPVEYRDAMPQWTRANKGHRDVRLCVSDETDVPVAVGLFDAMILIPHSLLDRLSEGEVDQICLHELAHLRRADDWSNGLQRVIIALLGWNPAAQFIGQQLDLEREVACDDWVLSFVERVRPYALCLSKMAESASWPRHVIPAPGVFATRKHISLRIERLLGTGRNIATNLVVAPAAAAIATVGVLAFLIAVVAPSVAAPSVAAPSVAAPPLAATKPRPQSTPLPNRAKPVPAPSVRIVAVPVVAPVHAPTADAKRLAAAITRQVNASVGAALSGSRVVQAGRSCSGCDFQRVDWSGRDMHGVNYIGVDLSDAKLVGTNFAGGNFNGVDFSKSNLRNASFRNAHLVGCDFAHADLTGVDFGGAIISGCQFTGAQLTSTELRGVLSKCTGCDFSRANLRGLNLSNVRANGDDFSGADLRGVNLAGANLIGIDFSNARLDGANFNGATLNACDLDGVDLTRVDLSKARMVGMDFSKGKPLP